MGGQASGLPMGPRSRAAGQAGGHCPLFSRAGSVPGTGSAVRGQCGATRVTYRLPMPSPPGTRAGSLGGPCLLATAGLAPATITELHSSKRAVLAQAPGVGVPSGLLGGRVGWGCWGWTIRLMAPETPGSGEGGSGALQGTGGRGPGPPPPLPPPGSSLSLPSFCFVSLLSLPSGLPSLTSFCSLGPPGLPAPSPAPATPHPFPGVRRLCQPSRLFGIV